LASLLFLPSRLWEEKRMSGTPSDVGAGRSLLRFYAEAGVDAALSEESIDRFALSRLAAEESARAREAERQLAAEGARAAEIERAEAAPPPPWLDEAPRSRPAPQRPQKLAAPSEAAAMAAREAAATCETLEALRETLAGFEGCNLRFTATNLVFADGNPEARVMFVGEAPGFEEDMQGRPFVGRSGQLLDRMLKAIGLDRSSAYIANVIPWRPPGNRDPTPQETEICRPFVERQIFLAAPDFLVPLGGPSVRQLLKTTTGITKLRGQWHVYQTGRREIRALPMFHPAYLLRRPLEKRLAWRDLLTLKEALARGG
jgi:DNA polymerase